MLELITLALFQVLSITGSLDSSATTGATTETCITGNGGWGHDITLPGDTLCVTGNGGWGHD